MARKNPTKGKTPGGSKPPKRPRKSTKPKIARGIKTSNLKEKQPHGRPTVYTEEIALEVCERLALGETLPMICEDDHIPSRATIMNWVVENRSGFSSRYTHARELQREAWADDMITISDDARNDYMERVRLNGSKDLAYDKEHVDRSKLRVETRKWLMKVGSPHKYGDKVEQTHKADEAFLGLWSQMGGGKSKPA